MSRVTVRGKDRGVFQLQRTQSMGMFLRRGGSDVAQTEWDWPVLESHENHGERVALLRPIPYEMTAAEAGPAVSVRGGKALSLNISSGGMLVLMDHAPEIEQVLRVSVPTPTSKADTPTLAEVRWTRRLPFGRVINGNGTYFVGLKFMF